MNNRKFFDDDDLKSCPHEAHRSRPDNGRALAALRQDLLTAPLAKAADEQHRSLLRLAAGEAEALAWVNGFPLLLLPVLLEEKVEAVRRYTARQAGLRLSARPSVLRNGNGF